jgi:hypothetical protein
VLIGLEWKFPHVILHVDVKGTDGTVVNWNVETLAPSGLVRKGLDSAFMKAGDPVSAHVFVAKDGARSAVTYDMTLPDGRTIDAVMGASGLSCSISQPASAPSSRQIHCVPAS